MAEDQTNSPATPVPPAGSPGDAAAQGTPNQLIINAQYLKDLSFENPRAPQSLVNSPEPPEVALDADVKARNLGPDMYEVMLTISAQAKTKTDTVFVVEISYGAVVTLKNASPEVVPVLVLIETPRLIFPFARTIIAEATRDGGFPPLLVNPIDFADLIRRQQLRAGLEAGIPGAPPAKPN